MLSLPARAGFRAFSYGGGVQSNAVMVLQAQGKINPYDVFIFANVGEDSENPATLAYIEDYAKPYMQAHGITFIEVQKTTRGEAETLLHYLERMQRSIDIPAYMSTGSPGNRKCTQRFKIEVIDRYLRSHRLSWVTMGLGISLDEFHRARNTQWTDHEGKQSFGFQKRREYPLLDLRLKRDDCRQIVTDAGLPMPPKSSCWFCPFHRRNEWIEMKRDSPDLFQAAVELEGQLNEKRAAMGRDRIYLHTSLTPLAQAVGDQLPLFSDEAWASCDAGVCMV